MNYSAYVFLIALFAHCNFSQLSAWPKTTQATFVGILFIILTFVNQYQEIDLLAQNMTGMSNINSNVK